MSARTSKIKRLLALAVTAMLHASVMSAQARTPAANLERRFQLNFLFPR